MSGWKALDHESIVRTGLGFIVQIVWVSFSLFVLYTILYPFIEFLFAGKELLFPYYQGFMPTFKRVSVNSVQYYFSLGFMHLGYIVVLLFMYYIKKMLQYSIKGRFFVLENVKEIKIIALLLAYLVVCPLSIESPLIYQEYPYTIWIRIFLLGYIMPWTVIGVITFWGIKVFKHISSVYEEQRLTV